MQPAFSQTQVLAEKDPHRYDEDYEIRRLQSSDPKERSAAAAALEKKGGRSAAYKIENIIMVDGFSRDVKRDLGTVLLNLSFKDVAHLARGPDAAERQTRRQVALALALPHRR